MFDRKQALRTMLEIRACEMRIQKLFETGKIRGSTHLCVGQEAVSSGVAAAMDARIGDTLTCTYRGHGFALALGMEMGSMVAELMGKASGCCKGKGGSMHLTDVRAGLIGTFAIVGAGVPVANGAALTAQIRKTGAVALTVFGDGAVNIGAFHEALNLASVWKLPTVFICENNLYGEYTAFEATSPVRDVADRAAAYGIPGVILDGQDAEAVYLETAEAVARAREGGGPTLLEAKTYRFVGHSRTDPASYRPPGEMDRWRARDPIEILRSRMVDSGEITQRWFTRARNASEKKADRALQWAEEQLLPNVADIAEDIWA